MNAQKPLSDYLEPNELARFNKLLTLSTAIIETGDELTDPSSVARVSSSIETESYMTATVQAIYKERNDWLALARERAQADIS